MTGQIPDLSTLTSLTYLNLSHNRLSGPVLDLNLLAKLGRLHLNNNQLSGPVPDLSALSNLTILNLGDNQLCLPAGVDLSGSNTVVANHIDSLNLAACTDADLAAVLGAPPNFTSTVGTGQVTLTWDAVSDAASYNLRAWDSFDRTWATIGGVLTGRTYTHTVHTDGRNYYYQVRARDANNVRGAWSEQLYTAVVPTQFPPPPPSFGLNMYYQKYMNVAGIDLFAPSVYSDALMVRAGQIITGMLANRSDLLEDMAANNTRIYIRDDFIGIASAWRASMPAVDPHCVTFVHEFVHVTHLAIAAKAGGAEFNARLQAVYQAAVDAGLWKGFYAATNAWEYFGDTARIWFTGRNWPSQGLPAPLRVSGAVLADYDPEVAAIIEEVFGDATVPDSCIPLR